MRSASNPHQTRSSDSSQVFIRILPFPTPALISTLFFPTVDAHPRDALSLPPSRRLRNKLQDRSCCFIGTQSEQRSTAAVGLHTDLSRCLLATIPRYPTVYQFEDRSVVAFALPTTNASPTPSIYHCSQTVAGILASGHIQPVSPRPQTVAAGILFFLLQPAKNTGRLPPSVFLVRCPQTKPQPSVAKPFAEPGPDDLPCRHFCKCFVSARTDPSHRGGLPS